MATDKECYYWLQGRHDDVRLELIEISHPSFSQIYRFVRNHADGVTVTHEDGKQYDYEYVPVTIQADEASDNLQQGFTIGIGDVGSQIPAEVQRVRDGDHSNIRPTVNYRVYLTSDLTEPMASVLGLEVTDNSPKREGAVFKCKAKEVNRSSTGLVYSLDKFPMLRGFL